MNARRPALRLAAAVAAAALCGARAAAAGLEAAAPAWIFGRAEAGTVVAHDFALSNAAATPLAILEVATSCGCTTAAFPRAAIPPGGTATVRASIVLPRTDGPVRETLVVQWQDEAGGGGATVLTLRGESRLKDGVREREVEAPLFASAAPDVAARLPDAARVTVALYGSPGCAVCYRFETEVLPALRARFGGAVRYERRDLHDPRDLGRLLARLQPGRKGANPRTCVVVGDRDVVADDDLFAGELERVVERHLAAPAVASAAQPDAEAVGAAYRRFGWGLVLGAGLADGFNPCAIGTLVFFVSLLGTARLGRWRVALAGGAFCLGVFITYVLLGLGLLQAWRALHAFTLVRPFLRAALALALLVLAALSFRDAAAAVRGAAGSMRLTLPPRLRAASHSLLRRGVRGRMVWLPAASFVLGVAVTLIEAVCTGQTYLPALAIMSRQGEWRALAMLLAYNLMFVAPLVLVLAGVLAGWRILDVAAWTRREAVVAKVALGILFLLLAAGTWLFF